MKVAKNVGGAAYTGLKNFGVWCASKYDDPKKPA
eukprot:CAMPEP_0176385786 /NCGR_PEP_ID=MMETSP0126-20121128/35421_1 /TAXON_ID=141414 ORGANISM="Strombidinopsis acuminatum, Strain SPMC142" /NCGR_SAMPLE_ID=MMETSP0126 /ASSEMBLY_ACC=CAM_ASM_000229 /LENGTH=33 /DNA_ID= /DNA_START= /DNA_END= /DNA_ORIENTATION=